MTAVTTVVQFSESHFEQLRVPVQRTRVEVFTERAGHTTIIFLPLRCSPAEIFEDKTPFFPVDEGGTVRFYARAAVVRIVVEEADATPDPLAALGVTEQELLVSVHLRNGTTLTGSVLSRCSMRPLDLFNEAAKSFAVHSNGKIHHVAKGHVERIEALR